MHKFLSLLAFSCILPIQIWAQHQVNFQLFGNRSYADTCLSSLWGYSANNKEYAIVGSCAGTSIVDITDPNLPEVAFVPDVNSIWREMKTWGHYAYVVTEGGSGLYIIDLSNLGGSNLVTSHQFTLTNGANITNAHTIFIDENGICYLFGATQYPNGQGYIALDLNTNPINPTFLGSFGAFYIHDAYVRDNIMYAGAILNGFAAIIDVTDKAQPIVLSSVVTPGSFTHNAWINDDKSVMYTTDEIPASFITAYDISDPEFPKLISAVRPSADSTSIPHNVHVVNDDWLAVSHYNKGVALIDAHKPDNMVYTGFYDTFPWNDSCCFVGNWGVYPYFPSGKWVVSDMSTGLWVVKPIFKRASYLEGYVSDSLTNLPIGNAKVHISQTYFQDSARTYIDGGYKTGINETGVYSVTYSAQGYISKTIQVTFLQTLTATRNVKLLKNPLVHTEGYATTNIIEIYPNPTSQILHIKNLEPNALYSIYSIEGKSLYQGSTSELDVSFLPKGTYYIQIQTKQGSINKAFIKL